MEYNLSSLKLLCDEIMTEENLLSLLEKSKEKNIQLKHYIGFEISGVMHIGQGLMTMMIIKELQSLGIKCTIFLADWHGYINDKLGSDLKFMKQVGGPLFIKLFEAAAIVCGVDNKSIEYIYASDIVDNANYWETVLEIGKNTTLSRVQRSIEIMGRKDGEKADFAKLIYPCMQAADVFAMQTHIAHGGSDQRKAYVIASDVADKIKSKPLMLGNEQVKPATVLSKFIQGLLAPAKELLEKTEITYADRAEVKMSKSKPDSSVFLQDSEDEIKRKFKKAYCPEGEIRFNAVLEWAKYFSFRLGEKKIEIIRKEEWGGNVTYTKYDDLEKDFVEKKIHPQDLKNAVADSLIHILKPARDFLNTKEVKDLLEQVQNKITR